MIQLSFGAHFEIKVFFIAEKATKVIIRQVEAPEVRGEIVYFRDVQIFSSRVKVRRKGQTDEFWTIVTAIDK